MPPLETAPRLPGGTGGTLLAGAVAGSPAAGGLLGAWLRDALLGGEAGLRPSAAAAVAAALSAAAAILAGLAFPALLKLLRCRGYGLAFEYGNVDITRMTAKAAIELHGKGSSKGQLTSLIPDSLQDLEECGAALAADAMAPSEELDRRARALAAVGAPPFRRLIKEKTGINELMRKPCTTLQLNIGLYCNQACTHCHVESSPLRTEQMSEEIVQRCLHLLRTSPKVNVLDITGGAPELNRGFKTLVEGAAELRDSGVRSALRIIDRCNLTVLLEPGQEGLLDFLVEHKVDIIASLPSYDAAQTDKQRGRKVFERSIAALRMLNERGYGTRGAVRGPNGQGLQLDLVFNPPGPFLPPRQELLEVKYKQQLRAEHSVEFDQLITIANMPVKRFFDFLRKKGTLEGYMDLLVRNFNAETVPRLMCLETINVGWDGKLFDCDFNQQLELHIGRPGLSVFDVESLEDERLRQTPISTAAHCFGCTAAQGSS